ncbi:MAG: hypothetical protein E7L09_05815 [Enterobacteriaceae bacterium]|nr:hypothetical protein [Enterobacteriaceae bacterium]
MKKHIQFAFLFSLGCAAGLFVGLAGGVEWGTFDCGGLSIMTIALSGMLSGMITYA